MKVIIIINGYPNAGKDTFVRQFTDYVFVNFFQKCIEYSSIECVIELLNNSSSLKSQSKTPEYRTLLSEVGRALEKYNGFRTEHCIEYVKNITIRNSDFLWIHMREGNLIEKLRNKIHDKYGISLAVVTIFLKSERGITDIPNDSDKNVENFKYDIYIDHKSSIEELKNCLPSLYKRIVQESNKNLFMNEMNIS
jgi:hypothetical protein